MRASRSSALTSAACGSGEPRSTTSTPSRPARPSASIKDKAKAKTYRSTLHIGLDELILSLNRSLAGWANYFRHGVSKATFSAVDYFAWGRLMRWIRAKYAGKTGLSMKELRRRFCDQGWRIAYNGVVFTGASNVAVTRYRYRGNTIPTPWAPAASELTSGQDTRSARCGESRTPGAEGGLRETAGGNTSTAPAGLPYEGALVKLSSVASKLTTESARDMIKAMIAGQRDPRTLAALARTRMKAKHDDLIEALDGMFDDHHGELAGLLMDQIAFLDERVTRLTTRITRAVAAMPAAWGVDADGTTGPDAGTGPDAAVLPAVARLAEIPGVSEGLARAIIAETGLDMSRFPTAGHLVSWAGLCPSARQSGPRTRAGKKGQGNTWLRGSLGQAAIGAARTDTFLGERYWRIARRRGKAKAQVAVARSILVIIWHLLADPAARFTDLGYGYYQARTDTDRRIKNHIRQIEALLGHPITITPKAA